LADAARVISAFVAPLSVGFVAVTGVRRGVRRLGASVDELTPADVIDRALDVSARSPSRGVETC